MAILLECPMCHKKQGNKNRKCNCGEDLVKAKRSKRVNYWISYRINGKQRREVVGSSIEDARAAEGKRKAQKKENPKVLEMLATEKTTFPELTEWYLGLESVKRLATYKRNTDYLRKFIQFYGNKPVNDLKLTDLEDYQNKRKKEGRAPATIDLEVTVVHVMVNKAFDNDKIHGDALKPFRRLNKVLKHGSNARHRVLTIAEYLKIIDAAQDYLKPIIILAFNTGMRRGEILKLKWSNVDLKAGVLRLKESDTKEGREKVVPLNRYALKALNGIVPHVHHDFVFTCNHRPFDQMTKKFANSCKSAGVPYGRKEENGITFHDIRRTVKTNMLKAGIDKIYRDIILGHSLSGMDIYYMAPTVEDLKSVMEKYTCWLDSQIELQSGDQNGDQSRTN